MVGNFRHRLVRSICYVYVNVCMSIYDPVSLGHPLPPAMVKGLYGRVYIRYNIYIYIYSVYGAYGVYGVYCACGVQCLNMNYILYIDPSPLWCGGLIPAPPVVWGGWTGGPTPPDHCRGHEHCSRDRVCMYVCMYVYIYIYTFYIQSIRPNIHYFRCIYTPYAFFKHCIYARYMVSPDFISIYIYNFTYIDIIYSFIFTCAKLIRA